MSVSTPNNPHLIVHAGMPKTGTTALQQWIYGHRPEFTAATSYDYPLIWDDLTEDERRDLAGTTIHRSNHLGVFWSLLGVNERIPIDAASRFLRRVKSSPESSFLSAEDLFFRPAEVFHAANPTWDLDEPATLEGIDEHWRTVAAVLPADSTSLVLVLRDPWVVLPSLFGEAIKNSPALQLADFETFADKYEAYLLYDEIVGILQSHFGERSVKVLFYERIRADIIGEFTARVFGSTLRGEAVPANLSYPDDVVRLKADLNPSLGPESDPAALTRLLRSLAQRHRVLFPDLEPALRGPFAEDVSERVSTSMVALAKRHDLEPPASYLEREGRGFQAPDPRNLDLQELARLLLSSHASLSGRLAALERALREVRESLG